MSSLKPDEIQCQSCQQIMTAENFVRNHKYCEVGTLRAEIESLKKEKEQLERLAKEYTEKFMPAYTRAKAVAQKLSWREDLPQEMKDALRQFLMT